MVDSRKRLRQPTAASSRFQVKLAAPHVTLVTVLPPSAQGTPVCHGYGFAAIDIFSVPASSQVLLLDHTSQAIPCNGCKIELN